MQGRRNSSWRELPRLPVIAPRNTVTLPSSYPSDQRADASNENPRSRLPPRSRSGCWTCRMRKVKCDEQRPTCGQCSRLGHECDYNPRLTFRDDTPRVIERMADVRTSGSSVWDPNSPPPFVPSRHRQDVLPAFSALTNDEERELKAETRNPGTFVVVANPSSFSSLPEYFDEETSHLAVSPLSTRSIAAGYFMGSPQSSHRSVADDSEDPNVVILKVFEDPPARGSQISTASSSLPSRSARPSFSGISEQNHASSLPLDIRCPVSRIEEARNGGRDAQLLQYYRSTISPAVIQVGHLNVAEDIFEIEARTFPPLFHAMMAVSALSIANKNGMHQADALEHYQQVIPAMMGTINSQEDSMSDGALFTHYLLLLYEIANSGPWQSNMWQQHCDRLHSIITGRQQMGGVETEAFVIWLICLVDTYALLSGSGAGTLAQAVFSKGIVPPTCTLPPLAPGMTQRFFPDETIHFPPVLDLNQKVVALAVRVGIAGRGLREEVVRRRSSTSTTTGGEETLYLLNRHNRLRAVQNLVRDSEHTWRTLFPQFWPQYNGPDELPPRIQRYLEHSQALYHALVIYTHTSMHPEQNYHREPESASDITASAVEILHIASRIVADERWDCKYMTFPLFLAGYASKNSNEKSMAYDILNTLEQHSYGKNTAVTKQFLGIIYGQQAAQSDQGVDIDWIEEMRRRDMRLVIFGE